MSAPAAPPYDLIAAELRGLAEQEGAELWRNRPRLTGLLLDHQPDLRREIRTVIAGVEQGVADALAGSERSLAAIAIDRQTALLETEAGLRGDISQNVVRTIAHALDLGPLPSVYAAAGASNSFPPVSAPPPQPAPAYGSQPQPAWGGYSSQPTPPPHPSHASRRRLLWLAAIIGGAAAVTALVLVVPQLWRGGGNVPASQGGVSAATNYADELADYGVPAQSTLRPDVGSRTPLQIAAGQRITTDELRQLIAANPEVILVDVLAGSHPRTLANAHWLPSAGMPGEFTDEYQLAAKPALDRLTGNDLARPLVFFCMGASCWESYNATLRAAAMGYTNLYWYRGGLSAWEAAGLPMQPLGAALESR